MKNTVNKSHMDTEKVAIVFGDCTLGVKSGNTHYIFSYTRGGLESLNKNGKEWL
ncbi:TPA: beta-galactosidase small subunit, partial [Enterococcus faecium]|nr:beta-galactosidase small subunit [Enterococcus faecium]